MRKSIKLTAVAFGIMTMLACSIFTSCTKDDDTATLKMPKGKANAELGIENVIPSSLGSVYVNNFNRYTKVTAPNGKPIHIVVQDKISEGQIVRCRGILEHYLKNYPGSKYGADKSAVANKMADNNAILCLLNGEDNGKNPVGKKVHGQPLYEKEIQVEGHSWYINQNYEYRDAAFEEILHFVHDNGIGVDGADLKGALPAFQAEIRAAQKNAVAKKLWTPSASQLKEWEKENSSSQEYLASVVDSYYGLWGAWIEQADKGMWGMYIAKLRTDIETKDPMGYAVMDNKFFHPYLTYNARIDASFKGEFSLKFDAKEPYTHHSRYLKDITLLGKNDVNVKVNELDNNITGNAGNNMVIFSGKSTEYTIDNSNLKKGILIVTDKVKNRDGKNTLKNINKLKFTDRIGEH